MAIKRERECVCVRVCDERMKLPGITLGAHQELPSAFEGVVHLLMLVSLCACASLCAYVHVDCPRYRSREPICTGAAIDNTSRECAG